MTNEVFMALLISKCPTMANSGARDASEAMTSPSYVGLKSNLASLGTMAVNA